MNFKIPQFVLQIIETFDKAGFEIYIVGGGVRDLIMGRSVSDWDFTTNATPEQILKLFPQGFYDNAFGTVGIAHESSKKPHEITTFRREVGYSDKRRPDEVEWGKSLEEDLARRDFTVNAIALEVYSPQSTDYSKKIKNKKSVDSGPLAVDVKIVDPFGGQNDLQNKTIRAVGDPVKRFAEDALRMMRAIRIASELGFVIEDNTFEAIKMHSELIKHIAPERISVELLKIMGSQFPYEGMVMLKNSGLLNQILPEVAQCFSVEQKSPKRHHQFDVGTHLFASLKHCPSKDPLVRFATLIHDVGKAQTREVRDGIVTFYNHEVVGANIAKKICKRLRFSKKQREKVWILVRRHQFTTDEKQTDSAVRRFIRRVGKENIYDMIDLRIGDRLGSGTPETSWRLEKFKERIEEVQKQPFSVTDLKVDGRDVMKILGIKPGPKVGTVLKKLFEEVEEDLSRNEREYLLKRIGEFRFI